MVRATVLIAMLCVLTSSTAYGSPVPPRTLDEAFAAIAEAVPSFGGAVVDEATGNLLILMSENLEQASDARDALAALLSDPRLEGLPLVAVVADFAFSELERWYDRMQLDVLAMPGVVWTDIDELANRLHIGIDPSTASIAKLEEALRARDIPLDAVVIEPVAPVRREQSDPVRPLVGGVQIGSGTSLCTLGVVAVRAGESGIITASHCTNQMGGVENTIFGQPTVTSPIARETVDPPLFTGNGCPPGRRCRYSDTAFARLLPTVSFSQGIIDGGQTYRVRAEGNPLAGQPVMKIGASTGRTRGRVLRTCVDINIVDSDLTILCQAQASYASAPGDSGSPIVTSVDGFRGPDVILLGTHWASGGSFSPIRNTQTPGELGPLETCIPQVGC